MILLYIFLNFTFFDLDQLSTQIIEEKIQDGLLKEEVALSGFIYKGPANKWILSSSADLKTCCIGTENKMWSQIFVEKEFSKNDHNKLVNLKGSLYLERNVKNSIYHLKNVEVLESKRGMPWITLGAVLFLVIVFYMKRYLINR